MGEKDQEKISCHVCRKMIPKATALQAEGGEYVLHFCDIGCLADWKRERGTEGPDQEDPEGRS